MRKFKNRVPLRGVTSSLRDDQSRFATKWSEYDNS